MAQPPFVPQSGSHVVRHYSSPPRRARSWWANRPGELPSSPTPGAYGQHAETPAAVATVEKALPGAGKEMAGDAEEGAPPDAAEGALTAVGEGVVGSSGEKALLGAGAGVVGDFGGTSAHQGPDQGYALLLAARFAPHLQLLPEESLNDVVAGCVAVALKRASLLGRAPVAEDLRIAFTHWGYLASDAEQPGADEAQRAAARRAAFFAGASSHEGRTVRRRIAESVSQTDLLVPSFARP